MEVTTDNVHDVRETDALIEGAGRNVRISWVYGDVAYDSSRVYGLLEHRGIDVVMKPKGNARSDRGHLGRRRAVSLIRGFGYGVWARVTGYGRRWAVEAAYSTFKWLFGEGVRGRDLGSIVVEFVGKVALYNALVNG